MTIITGSFPPWTSLSIDWKTKFTTLLTESIAPVHWSFRDIVLSNYGFTCAVTGQRFRRGKMIEAEAAHIIGKDVLGTDDPRNGLALSRTVHWAFDDGLFTISAEYEFGRTITESNEYGVGRGELALRAANN
jgi:hypothetical protein